MHSGTGNRLKEEEYEHTHTLVVDSITRSLIDTCTHIFSSVIPYWISVSHSFGWHTKRKIEFSDLLRFDNMAEDKIYSVTGKRVHRIGCC